MKAYSLSRPHPKHLPTVGAYDAGNPTGRNGGTRRGTTLTCSCGWPPFAALGRVTPKAPTAGGRAVAKARYREHLAAEAPQVDLNWAQIHLLREVHATPEGSRIGTSPSTGNTAKVLMAHALIRREGSWGDDLAVTAAGCAVLAQWDRWGWPKP